VVRNLRTDNLSPQFHVVYDNFFHTVYNGDNDAPENWDDLVIYSSDRRHLDADDPGYMPELDDEWLDDEARELRRRQRMGRRRGAVPPQGAEHDVPDPPIEAADEAAPIYPADPPEEEEEQNLPRRSTRPRYPVDRYKPGTSGMEQAHQLLFSLTKKAVNSALGLQDNSLIFAHLTDPEFGLVDVMIPHLQHQVQQMFKANKSDPDSPNYSQAMAGPHAEAFSEAMNEEIRALEEHSTWTIIKRSSVPEGANILPGTWVFKIKRYPDGRFRKTKARFCVRGDRQVEGIDYFESYAPVVSW
jgi:hypothetical protein